MDPTTIYENTHGPLILDRYEIIGRIGRGGFSTVYHAYDCKMERDVAVKSVMRTEDLGERATREARIAAKLSHPHIVTVFELAEDDDNVYLVSELVEGRTLKEYIDVSALSDRDCIEVAAQVLDALAHAHGRGVVHRDIKPDNIMLTGDDLTVKVMDFGIAQLENTQRLTRQGDVVGTLAYMSPEQAGGSDVDATTDVYSTALTLYECLAGHNPCRGATAAETVGRIQRGAPPLAHARPDLPEELSRIVEQAMDPDPDFRAGLKDFAAALKRLAPGLAAGGQATSVLQPTTIMRRAERPRPSAYQDLAVRYGAIAARVANALLAAFIAALVAYGSSYYPGPWRLPLVLGAAIIVGLLPRLGVAALGVAVLLPIISYSFVVGAMLTGIAALYFLFMGLTGPRLALLPVLVVVLQPLGLALVYPAAAGAFGRQSRGWLLALAGAVVFTAWQLFSGAPDINYAGVQNTFDLKAGLAGQYNPLAALETLAAPFRSQPALAVQPAIWLIASIPAAILIRRSSQALDLAGLILANAVLAGLYLAVPSAVSGFSPPLGLFLKTFALCVIIQVVVLLLAPRARLKTPLPQ